MGCSAGKVPASPSSRPENTLLGGGSHAHKEPIKEGVEVSREQASFDGEWCYDRIRGEWANGLWTNATINGTTVTWSDGHVSTIHVDSLAGAIAVPIRGLMCTGVLKKDRKIHWSNDDIWTRHRELPLSRHVSESDTFTVLEPQALRDTAHASQAHHCWEGKRSHELMMQAFATSPAKASPTSEAPLQIAREPRAARVNSREPLSITGIRINDRSTPSRKGKEHSCCC